MRSERSTFGNLLAHLSVVGAFLAVVGGVTCYGVLVAPPSSRAIEVVSPAPEHHCDFCVQMAQARAGKPPFED